MDITMTWGTTKSFEIAVTDQDDQPVPLPGKTLVCMAKRQVADDDDVATFKLTVNDGITVPGENGDHTAIIKISPSNTTGLPRTEKTTLHYMVFLQEGADRFPLEKGKIVVAASVAE